MTNLRLGDIIDDYCVKCRRLTNHAIVSIVNDEVAKVRCRSCYHDHNYQHEQIPPSKKDLKKMELFNTVLSKIDPTTAAVEGEVPEGEAVEGGVVEGEPAEAEAEAAVEPAPVEAPAKKTARGRAKKA
jgi:hypothetical protein